MRASPPKRLGAGIGVGKMGNWKQHTEISGNLGSILEMLVPTAFDHTTVHFVVVLQKLKLWRMEEEEKILLDGGIL